MARIILVRHGESEANRRGLALGLGDSPLTDLGWRQVTAVARALDAEPLSRVVASPQRRAFAMAEAIAAPHGLTVESEPALCELDVGEMEGLTFAEVGERFADFLNAWRGERAAALRMPGGESLQDVQERAWRALQPILEADSEGGVVVATHNFVIRAIVCHVLSLDLNHFRRFALELTSRTGLQYHDGHCWLQYLNDTGHLTAALRSGPSQSPLRA